MPGIHGISQDLLDDLQKTALATTYLRKVQGKDFSEFLRTLGVNQSCTAVSIRFQAILLRVLGCLIFVSGANEGDKKVFNRIQKLNRIGVSPSAHATPVGGSNKEPHILYFLCATLCW